MARNTCGSRHAAGSPLSHSRDDTSHARPPAWVSGARTDKGRLTERQGNLRQHAMGVELITRATSMGTSMGVLELATPPPRATRARTWNSDHAPNHACGVL